MYLFYWLISVEDETDSCHFAKEKKYFKGTETKNKK